MSESSRAMSSACFISLTVRGRNAFRTSGRLMVIFAMPSSVRSYLMSVKSWSLRQVSAMRRKLSRADELTQASAKKLGLLPRNAVPCVWADPELRVRQESHGAVADLDVGLVVLSGDPEHRNRDLVQAVRKWRQKSRRILAELAPDLVPVVVVLEALDDMAAEHRLRVPIAHDAFPRIGFETPGPRVVALAPLLAALFEVQTG